MNPTVFVFVLSAASAARIVTPSYRYGNGQISPKVKVRQDSMPNQAFSYVPNSLIFEMDEDLMKRQLAKLEEGEDRHLKDLEEEEEEEEDYYLEDPEFAAGFKALNEALKSTAAPVIPAKVKAVEAKTNAGKGDATHFPKALEMSANDSLDFDFTFDFEEDEGESEIESSHEEVKKQVVAKELLEEETYELPEEENDEELVKMQESRPDERLHPILMPITGPPLSPQEMFPPSPVQRSPVTPKASALTFMIRNSPNLHSQFSSPIQRSGYSSPSPRTFVLNPHSTNSIECCVSDSAPNSPKPGIK